MRVPPVAQPEGARLGGRVQALEAVVDQGVAVVIDAVADLAGRVAKAPGAVVGAGAAAGATATGRAGLRSRDAGSRSPRRPSCRSCRPARCTARRRAGSRPTRSPRRRSGADAAARVVRHDGGADAAGGSRCRTRRCSRRRRRCRSPRDADRRRPRAPPSAVHTPDPTVPQEVVQATGSPARHRKSSSVSPSQSSSMPLHVSAPTNSLAYSQSGLSSSRSTRPGARPADARVAHRVRVDVAGADRAAGSAVLEVGVRVDRIGRSRSTAARRPQSARRGRRLPARRRQFRRSRSGRGRELRSRLARAAPGRPGRAIGTPARRPPRLPRTRRRPRCPGRRAERRRPRPDGRRASSAESTATTHIRVDRTAHPHLHRVRNERAVVF